jgi:hypothetical protein
MRPPARDRERGGVLPLLLGMLLVLAAAFFGATTIGRVVIAKGEAQRAADAACLAMSSIVKHEGLQVLGEQQSRAEALGGLNSSLLINFVWSPPLETATTVDFRCHASAQVPAPMFIWSAGSLSVGAEATGRAEQQTFDQAEKKHPQLVMALDFSGSMRYDLNGTWDPSDTTTDSFHILLGAIRKMLDENFEVMYGLVAFASEATIITPKATLDNVSTIREQVDLGWACGPGNCGGCPYTPGPDGTCNTASGDALERSLELLNNSSHPNAASKYVLFVSDGQPTVPSGNAGYSKAYEAAEQLWNSGVTIFTLHIVNNKANKDALKQFMVNISGSPEERQTEKGYYFDAENPDEVEDFIVGLGGRLACEIGPLDPAPPDYKKVHAFLRVGSVDDPLINARTVTSVPIGDDDSVEANEVGDLWDRREPFRDGDYFFYDETRRMLFVTPQVCQRVREQGQHVKIRFKSPQLTQ